MRKKNILFKEIISIVEISHQNTTRNQHYIHHDATTVVHWDEYGLEAQEFIRLQVNSERTSKRNLLPTI